MLDTHLTEQPKRTGWRACGEDRGICQCGQIWDTDYPVAIVTRGKWGDDYPALRIVEPGLGEKVEAYMEQITYGEVSEELFRKNMLLLAAAPDLFRACKLVAENAPLIVEWLTENDPNALAQIRAAIARAEATN